jgi:hypothetical protein
VRGDRERRLRDIRLESGVCVRCGRKRGENGTGTQCRPCADHSAARIRASKAKPKLPVPRSANGFQLIHCENCFEPFEWKGSGQRTMCDACVPWFPDGPIDHEAEQARAMKVLPERPHGAARSQIARWLKEGHQRTG